MSDANNREQQLNQVIADYSRRIDEGEEVDQQALVAEHPDLADSLVAYFENSAAAENLVREFEDRERSRKSIDTDVSQVARTTNPDSAPAHSEPRISAAQLSGREPFGRYRIEKTLGEGAMGSVYLAFDSELQRQVALKVPKFDGRDDEELKQRFLREARSAAGLQHRNICPVYDIGLIDGVDCISMD